MPPLLFRRFVTCFYESNTGGNGTAGSSPTPAPQPQGQQAPAEPAQALDNLISRHNNDMRSVVELLYRENFQHRETIRGLQGQVPDQGAVVLSGDDAQHWQSYSQLGELSAIQQQLQERQTFERDLTQLRQDMLLRDVASIMNFDRDVLQTVGGSLTYVIKDEQVEGKPVQVVYVKDGDQETKLSAFAEQKWQKFLPSLRTAPAAPQARGTPAAHSVSRQPQQPQGEQDNAPRRLSVRL